MDLDKDKSTEIQAQGDENMQTSNLAGASTSSTSMERNSSSRMNAKQLAVQQKIQLYFHRLTQGCSHPDCTNPNCASNPSQKKLSGNEAAAKAVTLLRQKAEICLVNNEQRKTDAISVDSTKVENAMDTSETDLSRMSNASTTPAISKPRTFELPSTPSTSTEDFKKQKLKVERDKLEVLRVREVKYLTEEKVDGLIANCRQEQEKMDSESSPEEKSEFKDPHSSLFCELTEVFSNVEGLNRSFLMKHEDDESSEKMEIDNETLSKVQEPSSKKDDIEVENRTKTSPVSSNINDEMSLSNALASYLSSVGEMSDFALSDRPNTSGLGRTGAIKKKYPKLLAKREQVIVHAPTVDIESIRRVYQKLSDIDRASDAFVRSLELLAIDADAQFKIMRQLEKTTINLNMFVTIMENPSLHSPEYLETALPGFCKCMAELPIKAQEELVKFWSKYTPDQLRQLVIKLQQLLTYKVVWVKFQSLDEDDQIDLHKVEAITSAVKCLKILYYASLYGGKIDTDYDQVKPRQFQAPDDEFVELAHRTRNDPLAEILGIAHHDVIEPLIPMDEFQNEILNQTFNVYNDFTNSEIEKVTDDEFTFMNYPFILNTINKTTYFFYDNKIQMLHGRRLMMLQSLLHRAPVSPYLRLKVRRDHIIADALVRLELISTEHPQDFMKQLYVEFEDEQGVDEGGVSKEFFQLVVEQIFNPDYGMFTYDETTNLFWFNAHSFENKAQFTLIGIVLGLAIYNSCILDVKFPSVVYKKLIGKRGKFEDMKQSHPALHSNLKNLLEYEGNVEEDLMVTFCVEYGDMFGEIRKHDLKPDGENIPVTHENRKEYVDLYANWLLNESIAEQFNEFRHGFNLTIARSSLKYLFRTDELEILISGSQEYDFNSLEDTTEYDGGYSKDSPTVKDFWSVVHAMTEEDKRKLLQFTTGTDRAPVGGLSQLRLVIARNGPDSDRLPTSHTCFNVILLPDYGNRDKLKERLHKAITYSKGFGML